MVVSPSASGCDAGSREGLRLCVGQVLQVSVHRHPVPPKRIQLLRQQPLFLNLKHLQGLLLVHVHNSSSTMQRRIRCSGHCARRMHGEMACSKGRHRLPLVARYCVSIHTHLCKLGSLVGVCRQVVDRETQRRGCCLIAAEQKAERLQKRMCHCHAFHFACPGTVSVAKGCCRVSAHAQQQPAMASVGKSLIAKCQRMPSNNSPHDPSLPLSHASTKGTAACELMCSPKCSLHGVMSAAAVAVFFKTKMRQCDDTISTPSDQPQAPGTDVTVFSPMRP